MKSLWCVAGALALCASSAQAADDPVQKVHQLELGKQPSERASVIAILPADDADARSHWLKGEVRIGEEWVHYSRVADHQDRWAQLHRYQEQRSKFGGTLEDQLTLANQCRDSQLLDEERAHLHGVIARDPMHVEARQRLGHQYAAGVWLTPSEIQQSEEGERLRQSSVDRWGKEIETHKASLFSRSSQRRAAAESFFDNLRDSAAIPVMEQAFARGNEPEQQFYLTWVCRLGSWHASAAVARLAIETESPKIRVKSVQELSKRRPEEFAPVLLSAMKSPVILEADMVKLGHWWLYSQRTISETADKKIVQRYNARFAPQSCILHPFQPLRVPLDELLNQPTTGQRIMSNLNRESQKAVDEQNARSEFWNNRISSTLGDSLGLAGLSRPQDWWAWWTADQGYVEGEREQLYSQYFEDWYISRRRGQIRKETKPSAERLEGHASCFVAGTPIQTETGLRPIESVKLGDRVLAQNLETGEVAFRPVLRVTQTDSALTKSVRVGNETLVSTTAHPYWVNGQGWRLARELEPGMQFHSLSGAVEVAAVSPGESETVYNLEVADFNTYFVGQGQILTHDITVRQPTDMALPGFSKETAAVVSQK